MRETFNMQVLRGHIGAQGWHLNPDVLRWKFRAKAKATASYRDADAITTDKRLQQWMLASSNNICNTVPIPDIPTTPHRTGRTIGCTWGAAIHRSTMDIITYTFSIYRSLIRAADESAPGYVGGEGSDEPSGADAPPCTGASSSGAAPAPQPVIAPPGGTSQSPPRHTARIATAGRIAEQLGLIAAVSLYHPVPICKT